MSSPDINVTAAIEWTQLLYPAGTPGRVVISMSRANRPGLDSIELDPDRAPELLPAILNNAGIARVRDVYLRCTTITPGATSEGGRGTNADSVYLPGLWGDVDYAGPGHRHDPGRHNGLTLPPDADGARGVVEASGLPAPSAWVHSGGGLYPWWLIGGGYPLDVETQRGLAADLSVRWQAALKRGAESLGWHYGTQVSDLARVLRLPGTVNRKVPGAERLCMSTAASGPRYSMSDLLSAVGGLTAPLGVPTQVPRVAQESSEQFGPVVASKISDGHLSPLDDFEQRHSWAEILTGWTLVSGTEGQGECRWRHPDATHPESATTGRAGDRDRLYVFSDQTGLPANEPLTKGYVYAQLWHRGDMGAAARAVQALGYGDSASPASSVSTGDVAETGRRLELVPASQMRMRAARWMWAEAVGGPAEALWVPLGGLTLLGGREGVGKTTWTYRLIALLTRGALPGDLLGQPRGAVIAASEDDWEATILPRLTAAGADTERVYRVDAVEPDRRTGLSLPDDLSALSTLLGEHPDIALLVLDPIITVLAARLDSHKDHEVRKALEPISALAHGRGITVLGLIHDNKSSGTDLSTRLMGSRAFVAVARAALVCAEEREEPDEGEMDDLGADPVQPHSEDTPVVASQTQERIYLLGQVKSNLGARVPTSIRYRITGTVVGHDDDVGKDIAGSYVIRLGRRMEALEETVRASESARPGAERERGEVKAAILAILAEDGEEQAGSKVRDRLIAEGGYSLRTIERAARDLTKAGKILNVLKGRDGYWSLPHTERVADVADVADVANVADGGRSASVKEADASAKGTSAIRHRHSLLAREESGGRPCGCSGGDDGQHVPWCSQASGHGMTA